MTMRIMIARNSESDYLDGVYEVLDFTGEYCRIKGHERYGSYKVSIYLCRKNEYGNIQHDIYMTPRHFAMFKEEMFRKGRSVLYAFDDSAEALYSPDDNWEE